jgi:toxin CcdB
MMKQFALYENNNKKSKRAYPFFVNVQSDLLYDLNTRMVIPLSPQESIGNLGKSKLCPLIDIDGVVFVLLTQQMTSVPCSILKKELGSLEHYRYDILGAIDLLLTGI